MTNTHAHSEPEGTQKPTPGLALQGVRVLDLGQFYFGPYASLLLARLGADVIKIEAPNGDPYRRLPTAIDGNASVQFELLNAGKRLITLDLKSEAGRGALLELAKKSDVIIQNLAPGALDRFGLGYEVLSEANPRLILASGTGYGSFGPYAGQPAMDISIQARTAFMSTTGFDEGPPIRTGPSVVDFLGGAHLLAGVLAALYQREHSGKGQHVEVSLQDASITSLSSNIAGYINSNGKIPERTGNRNGGLAVTPYNSYRTSDGWIAMLCPTDAHWERLCDRMNLPEDERERYRTMAARCDDMDRVDAIVEDWTKVRTKDELNEILKEAYIPAAPVISLSEVLEDPHVKARNVLRRMHDELGDWVAWGSPLFLSDSPTVAPTRPGRLGNDMEEVFAELGIDLDGLESGRS